MDFQGEKTDGIATMVRSVAPQKEHEENKILEGTKMKNMTNYDDFTTQVTCEEYYSQECYNTFLAEKKEQEYIVSAYVNRSKED